jgi:hypothetical protein
MNKDLVLKRYLKKEIKTILLNEGMMDKLAKRAKGALSNLAIAGALSLPVAAFVGDGMAQDAARTQTHSLTREAERKEDKLDRISTNQTIRLNDRRLEQIGNLDQLATTLGGVDKKDEIIGIISEIKEILNLGILNINDIKEQDTVTFDYFKRVAANVYNALNNNELYKNNDVVAKHADTRSVLTSLGNIKNTN